MKPGRGILAQEKALTFETPFFDGAQGIIPMILALLADTILFSRRVIDIQNMLLNIMTVGKRKAKKKKQSITARTDRRFQQLHGVAINVCMHLNFQCDRIEGVPGILGNKGKKRRNIEGNKGTRTCFSERGNKKTSINFL